MWHAYAPVVLPAAVAVTTAVAADVATLLFTAPRVGRVAAAVIDNAGHGAIAAATWAAAVVVAGGGPALEAEVGALARGAVPRSLDAFASAAGRPTSLAVAALCGVLSCALDADHFLSAHSFAFRDALNLSARPFGHAFTFVLAAVGAAALLPAVLPTPVSAAVPGMPHAWLLLAVAWVTHHLRDATRRGLWLWPLGSTPPLPAAAHLALLAAAPFAAAWALRRGGYVAGDAVMADGAAAAAAPHVGDTGGIKDVEL